MINTEFKEVVRKESVIISCICDNCGKILICNKIPKEWYQFSASHTEWGNDSIDSIEKYLSCNFDCYKENLKKAVKEFIEYPSAEIDNKCIDFLKNIN